MLLSFLKKIFEYSVVVLHLLTCNSCPD